MFIIFFGLYCVWNQSKFEFWSNVKTYTFTKNQNGSRHQTSGDPFLDLLGKVRLRRKIQKNRRHKMDINRSCEKIFVSNKYDGIFRVTRKSLLFANTYDFQSLRFFLPIYRSSWMICNFDKSKNFSRQSYQNIYFEIPRDRSSIIELSQEEEARSARFLGAEQCGWGWVLLAESIKKAWKKIVLYEVARQRK